MEKARERKSFNVIREPLCASLESGSGSEREREGERYVTYVTLQCCVTVLGYTVLLDRRLHRVGVVLRLNTLMLASDVDNCTDVVLERKKKYRGAAIYYLYCDLLVVSSAFLKF